jgi:hypothetical protein
MERFMILKMTPADELASLRAQIRKLAQREAQLRFAFAAGELPTTGMSCKVIVSTKRHMQFRKELLPDDVLADPQYWQVQETQWVDIKAHTVSATHAAAPLIGPPNGRPQ